MSKDLSRLNKRIQKSFEVNFSKPQEIDATINSVNIGEKIFIVKSHDDNCKIECRTNTDITKIKIGDDVTMKGWLKFYPNTSKIYFMAEYIYVTTEKQKYSSAINTYQKLRDVLNNKKCQVKINKITSHKPPMMVYNIGLIVLPDDEENLTNFKIAFQERCCGKLFIYHLTNEKLAVSLGTALEYFKKYHSIDLICLLTNQPTLKSICDLSSQTNIRYMFSRTNVPFVLSVLTNNEDKIEMTPLSAVLSNTRINGITNCIDYIHNIQSSYRKQLDSGIEIGTSVLQQIIENNKKKLFEYRLCIAELINSKSSINMPGFVTPVEKLKDLLIKRLQRERFLLYNKKIAIMKNIIEDERLQTPINMFIASEKKIFNQNNDKMSVQIKKVALQQNQHFQEHPDEIPIATKNTDTIVHEMTNQNQKKIENKSSDNISGDILSINIQRTNGDF